LKLEQTGSVNRTENRIDEQIGLIELTVNQLERERQRASRKKRAGTKYKLGDFPSPRTLLEWVRRYERSNFDLLSLVPGTHRSGNHTQRFCETAAKLIGKCAKAYGSIQRPSKRQIAQDCIDIFDEANRERETQGLPLLDVPSKRSVERVISSMDPYETHAQRHGASAANRKFAAFEQGIKASYPMERIEIDEWKVDLVTLLAKTGAFDALTQKQRDTLPKGRFWLYLAIDCATRCVLAMRLAQKPNHIDAILTLKDVARDKSLLSSTADCRNRWHQCGGLGAVVTDQGAAFIHEDFRTAIHDLGGHPERPPAGVPKLRGRVERIFRSLGSELMPLLAGRTFSNPKDRGDYPAEELTVHTANSLMQVLLLHVVDIYHNKPHAGLRGETPANCWKRLSSEFGIIPVPSAQKRCQVFGIALSRPVTRVGVTVFNFNYANDELRDMLRHSHTRDVQIRVDPENLGWILIKFGREWRVAFAIQESAEGLSLAEWRYACRELNLKHRRSAALNEDDIRSAVAKIKRINEAELKRMQVSLPYLTKSDLLREERQLNLGLQIKSDDGDDIGLPDAPNFIGHLVPREEADPDLFSIGDVDLERQDAPPDPGDLGFDDDWGIEED